MALSMVNSIVKWNPFSSSFVAYDSKLKLYDVVALPKGSRDAVLSKSMNVSGEVTTLDWYQDVSAPKALAFGTSVASVYFLNWSKGQPEYFALRQAMKSRQQCTEVAWNRFQFPNQVAAGFDKSKKYDRLLLSLSTLFISGKIVSMSTISRREEHQISEEAEISQLCALCKSLPPPSIRTDRTCLP
jgi:hypothetical protein